LTPSSTPRHPAPPRLRHHRLHRDEPPGRPAWASGAFRAGDVAGCALAEIGGFPVIDEFDELGEIDDLGEMFVPANDEEVQIVGALRAGVRS
jgi:hypothetical protein